MCEMETGLRRELVLGDWVGGIPSAICVNGVMVGRAVNMSSRRTFMVLEEDEGQSCGSTANCLHTLAAWMS